ncbi:MAG: ABC transporter ATP-binding protein [Christensenellaceae bacterium]|nr:ABC transporter ATP-binding protein [Christensenellaceae bacterium]
MLSVEDMTVTYREIVAVSRLSIHIKPKEILTIIGANGAGKSTTLKAIAGLEPVKSGKIRFKGEDITAKKIRERVDLGICLVPEGRLVFPGMSVINNMQMGFLRNPNRHRFNAIAEHVFELFPRLAERKKQVAGTMSGGEQQMLAIARGMMREPELLLLDEPSLGISPILVEEIAKTICRLRDEGMSILLVEQNASMALSISDRGYVLETGNLALSGESSSLLNDDRVRSAYLAI